MDSNNMAGMPDAQNQPVAPAEPNPVAPNPVEQALAEAPAEPAPMDVPMGAPAKKSGKGMLYGMIFFIILAVAGIGFGVYMMMDANTQKTSYDKQVADLKAQNNKLLDQIAEGGCSVDDGSANDDSGTSSVNSEDYIYVGEWGLKIKKPENWRDSVEKYNFYNGYPQAVDSLEIRERKNSSGAGVAIMVGGASCDTQVVSEHSVCFVVDGKVVIVNELVGETTPNTESGISEAFKNHFTNVNNYSKI